MKGERRTEKGASQHIGSRHRVRSNRGSLCNAKREIFPPLFPRGERDANVPYRIARVFFPSSAPPPPSTLSASPSSGSFHLIPFYVYVYVSPPIFFPPDRRVPIDRFRPSCTAVFPIRRTRNIEWPRGWGGDGGRNLRFKIWDRRTQHWINHGAERGASLN